MQIKQLFLSICHAIQLWAWPSLCILLACISRPRKTGGKHVVHTVLAFSSTLPCLSCDLLSCGEEFPQLGHPDYGA